MFSRNVVRTVLIITATSLSSLAGAPARAKDVTIDLSALAPAGAKVAPPAPKQPSTQLIEINPDDVLIVRCPTKQFPGDKGWIEYHAALLGGGCLISTMNRREANAEVFQATSPGSQKIVVGLKAPGGQIEKDCVVTVRVVSAVAQGDYKSGGSNVQSFAGQKVFGNKTAASTGSNATLNNGSNYNGNNQVKPTAHSIEEQSHSTVKSY